MVIWLLLGIIGWVVLITYRVFIEGAPKVKGYMSYVRGFLLAIILGPLCFVFLGYLMYTREPNDQTPNQ